MSEQTVSEYKTKPVVYIIPSNTRHVQMLSECIRDKDRREALSLGVEPEKALFYSYRRSVYRYTAFVDYKIAAMWGVFGTPVGNTGKPYLVTSDQVYKISPWKFARIYKRELDSMSRLFPVLENVVDANYPEAVRLLRLTGFELSEPFPLGTGMYQKFTLKSKDS